MFSEILRHPRNINRVLGLSVGDESGVQAESRHQNHSSTGTQVSSDVGLESVVKEYRWMGPYVLRVERLESDASVRIGGGVS